MFVPVNENCLIIDFRIYKVKSIKTDEEIPKKQIENLVIDSEGVFKIKNFEKLLEPSNV